MSPLIESPSRVTFGLFEADLQSGELWKAGKRIKIQSQPFKVLATLLERPGEIVSREDLQLRLWGKDTTVDFDHSLGTAINKIREALGDSADNPRFVETLARRGYRFIAPVGYPAQATTPAGETSADQPEQPHTPLTDPILATALPALMQSSKWKTPAYIASAAAILAGAVALGLYLGSSRQSTTPLRISQITHNGRIAPGAPAMSAASSTLATRNVAVAALSIQ